ncbi:MAG: hypothetical protein E7384_03435 [Ruminococcaceae bacterium]|nr:hypothetical protein [Oscillospiraceae bacterium]
MHRILLDKSKIIVFLLIVSVIFVFASCAGQAENTLFPSENETTAEVSVPSSSNSFNVKTFESLEAISAYSHCEKVTIQGNIELAGDIVFNNPVDITVKGFIVSNTHSVIVKSDKKTVINVDITSGSTVSEGAIIIDAPNSALNWTGGCVPGVEHVIENMNVKSFNDNDLSERLTGGTGKSVFESVSLKDPKGSDIGCEFSVKGNVITVLYPFSLHENKLRDSEIEISASDCKEKLITDRNKNKADKLSLNGKYVLTLSDDEGNTRGYYLNIKRRCESLPVISVYTDGGKSIDSKETYVSAQLGIDCSGSKEYKNFSLDTKSVGIKGRGNASWNYTDKKAYRLKFDEKVSVLGMKADKDWVLVPNYFDKSLIRNVTAHELAKQMENLEYTPTHILVDLFLNGEYRGVYTIADKIEVSNNKVDIETSDNVVNPGFLIEIGWDYSSENIYGKDYFDVEIIKRLYVKDPEITSRYNSRMNDIIEYVRLTDRAISSGEGYEKYIDVDSMVDWFIIAELTNNTEMAFYRSCYFYREEGGKIKMGPVWDFDMAFGNHSADISGYDGWATAEAEFAYVNDTWTTYLIKDKVFMDKVRARWNEKKEILLKTAEDTIDNSLAIIGDSQTENFKKWDILGKQIGEGNVDYNEYDTYEKQVEYVREFVEKRAEWMTNRLNNG